MKKIKEILDKDNVNDAINLVQNVMANKLVLVIFLIVQGITIFLKPTDAPIDMARSVSYYVLFATGTLILSYLINKQFSKSNIITLVLFILSIICVIYPKLLGEYLIVVIAITILFNGLINVLHILKLNKLSSKLDKIRNSAKGKMHTEKAKDIEEGIAQEANKIINPILGMSDKMSKKTFLYIILNILFVIFGFYLLIFDPETSVIGMKAIGLALVLSGLLDLPILIKSFDTKELLKVKNDLVNIIK